MKTNFIENKTVMILIILLLSIQVSAKKDFKVIEAKPISTENLALTPKQIELLEMIDSSTVKCNDLGYKLAIKKIHGRFVIGLECGDLPETLIPPKAGPWILTSTSYTCVYKCEDNAFTTFDKGYRTTCNYKRNMTSLDPVAPSTYVDDIFSNGGVQAATSSGEIFEYSGYLTYLESLGGVKYSQSETNAAKNANCPKPIIFNLAD